MLQLQLIGLPKHLEGGVREVAAELSLLFSDDGIPVYIRKGDGLHASLKVEKGEIVYNREVEIFRCLAHLSREGVGCDIAEHSCFDTNGFMLDVSRNAMVKPEAVRMLLRRMALMGMNLFMLYTEDTYEVENYPYFGYMRGGYKKTELKALDDYAYALGVEMCPCIQTLGHSKMITRWSSAMSDITDVPGVLLVGEEKTYRYINQILADATEPYRSKRIHIGMDECGGLGSGKYRAKNGNRPSIDIFQEHITRVRKLTDTLGLKPMIWTDMYFALVSPTHDYDPDCEMPEEVLRQIPSDMGLVYWDYYRHDQSFYEGVLRQHLRCNAPVLFAGGLWNWASPTVNYSQMLSSSLPALRACKECGVREVFVTAWGDEGAECSMAATLYGLAVYAEFGYTGEYDAAEVERRFRALTGENPRAFLDLSLFNMVPTAKEKQPLAPNPSFYMLWEDPMTLVFEKDLENVILSAHYYDLYDRYCRHTKSGTEEFSLLWQFYRSLSLVLAEKCQWREEAPRVVRAKDHTAAHQYAVLAHKLAQDAAELHECWYQLWHRYNKPNGWDVIDLEMGGLCARLRTAARTMDAFAAGEIETIPEMDIEKLPYAPLMRPGQSEFDGSAGFFAPWEKCTTPSLMFW